MNLPATSQNDNKDRESKTEKETRMGYKVFQRIV